VQDATTSRQGIWVLVATGLGLFMIFVDAMIVNVAIPDIQREFDAGESGIQWVVAAYSLTMAMFMMTGATFGDHYGRRRAYVVGIVIFCIASVGCALAPGIEFLSVMRGFQGIGAAVVNVASLALVGAAFPDPDKKARASRRWLASRRLSSALGSWPRATRRRCGWHSSGSRLSALPAGSPFRPPRVRRWGRSRRSDRAWRRGS
jgi:MFS family permease